MTFAPTRQLYQEDDATPILAADAGEPPDCRLNAADRRIVRRLLERCEAAMTTEMLMHLSCGAEGAARRKRALENRR